jgi:hypothetical protein
MENLEKLGLPEIKSLCKKYNIGIVGEKKDLIKKLNYFLDPIDDVLNVHPGRKIQPDKKIVGVKISEKDKLNQILKNKGTFLYYSLGYQYYVVDKQLEV